MCDHSPLSIDTFHLSIDTFDPWVDTSCPAESRASTGRDRKIAIRSSRSVFGWIEILALFDRDLAPSLPLPRTGGGTRPPRFERRRKEGCFPIERETCFQSKGSSFPDRTGRTPFPRTQRYRYLCDKDRDGDRILPSRDIQRERDDPSDATGCEAVVNAQARVVRAPSSPFVRADGSEAHDGRLLRFVSSSRVRQRRRTRAPRRRGSSLPFPRKGGAFGFDRTDRRVRSTPRPFQGVLW